MTSRAAHRRTIVLGFDALDATYLDRFSASLPNFEALRERGVEAPLESTLPPWTGSAWPSMYTGTDPSHHGVFDFFRQDDYPDSGDVVSRTDVDAPALWNYLSSEGRPSVVCNVPVTHPAEPIEGALVPGYLANEDAPGHPEGVREELSDAIGEEYRIYSRAEMASDGDAKLAGYLDLIDLRRRAARALLEEREWELAVLQVQKTDAVFHNFDDDEAFRAVYEAADEFVGTVLDVVENSIDEPVDVVVCSDHGIGPVEGYHVHVNDVLREHGYVEAAPDGEQQTLQAEKQQLLQGDGGAGAGIQEAGASADRGDTGADGADPSSETDGTPATNGAGAGGANEAAIDGASDDTSVAANGDSSGSVEAAVFQRLVDGLAHVGVTPARVYAAAERLGVEDALLAVTPDAVGSAAADVVDWRASAAYCEKSTRLGVRINLEGREPSGVVPESEYDDVRADLIELLSSLTTPDGDPVFETVVPREAVYDGPHLDRAPDVFAVPDGMDHSISTAMYGSPFTPVDKYDHKRTGVFLGAGPSFDPEAVAGTNLRDDADSLSLVDVAPVVMASLGLAVPSRMTGAAPQELLSVPVERAPYDDVSYGSHDESSNANEAVTDRLEDLGYL